MFYCHSTTIVCSRIESTNKTCQDKYHFCATNGCGDLASARQNLEEPTICCCWCWRLQNPLHLQNMGSQHMHQTFCNSWQFSDDLVMWILFPWAATISLRLTQQCHLLGMCCVFWLCWGRWDMRKVGKDGRLYDAAMEPHCQDLTPNSTQHVSSAFP